MSTATISVRVSEEEKNILKSYADYHKSTISEMIRKTMLEKIEDEYDLKVFEEYEREKEAGTLDLMPAKEFWKEMNL